QEKKVNKELNQDQKLSVLEKIANKPVREAERITLSLSSAPELARPDRVNVIADERIEMKFTASMSLQQKVEKLKGWLAHSKPDISMGELFEKLCDLGLQEWNPAGKTAAPRKRRGKSLGSKESMQVPVLPPVRRPASTPVPVPVQVRREVFKKA